MKKLHYLFGLLFTLMLLVTIKVDANAAIGTVTGVRQVSDEGHVTWNPVPGADEYSYSVSKDKIEWRSMGYISEEEPIKIKDGEILYIRIRARYDDESGEWSEPVEVVKAPKIDRSQVKASNITENGFVLSCPTVPGADGYKAVYNGKELVSKTPTLKLTGLKKNASTTVLVSTIKTNYSGTYTAVGNAVEVEGVVKPSNIKPISRGSSVGGKFTFRVDSHGKYTSSTKYVAELWTATGKPRKLKSYTRNEGSSFSFTHKYLKTIDYFQKNTGALCKIRLKVGVKNFDGKYIYSSWGKWNYVSPAISYKTSYDWNSKKYVLEWIPLKGVKGYSIYATKDKYGVGKYKRIARVKKNTYKISMNTKYNISCINIVPYVIVNGKKVEVVNDYNRK